METRLSRVLLYALAVSTSLYGMLLQRADAQVREPEKLWPANFAQLNDARGNMWDVQADGSINDGYSDCFDGAMHLLLNGTQFQGASNQMRVDRSEYVLGQTIGGMRVTRRILVDIKRGSARYLDVLENTQNSKATLNIQLRTNLGSSCQQVVDSSGSPFTGALGKGATGICAIQSSSRPCVYFMIADPRSKTKPVISVAGNRTFTLSYSLAFRPRQTISLLHVIAQRRSLPATGVPDVAKQFYARRPLDVEIPLPLGRTVANFHFGPSDFFDAGPLLQSVMELSDRVGVERGQGDFLVLGEDARFRGQLEGDAFVVKTRFGKTQVPLAEVAMLIGGNGMRRRMQLHLRNGDVLQGDVDTVGDFLFRGQQGLEVRLEPAALDLLLMRTDKQLDGKADEDVKMMIATQDGSRLGVRDAAATTLHLATPWGPFEVKLADVGRLWHDDEPVPTFQLLLTNRSRLPVIPATAGFHVNTPRWGQVELLYVEIDSIANLSVANTSDENDEDQQMPVPYCQLSGETRLCGTIDLASVPLRSATGESRIAMAQVSRVVRDEASEDPARFVLILDSGESMAGLIPLKFIPVRMGDQAWRVPISQFQRAELKREPVSADSQVTTSIEESEVVVPPRELSDEGRPYVHGSPATPVPRPHILPRP